MISFFNSFEESVYCRMSDFTASYRIFEIFLFNNTPSFVVGYISIAQIQPSTTQLLAFPFFSTASIIISWYIEFHGFEVVAAYNSEILIRAFAVERYKSDAAVISALRIRTIFSCSFR